MCACLKKPLEEGAFTIRRNENLFWSGTWTDMTIEQFLMRSGKTYGGLVNITHKESARTKWLLTAHIVAQYSEALRKLTENAGGTWSEQAIGAKFQERLTGKRFTMKKKDQAQTFSIMRKPIKVDGEDVRMSPAQLYHRLLCIARANGQHDPCIFSS